MTGFAEKNKKRRTVKDTVSILVELPRSKIAYVSFIFQCYEYLGVVLTRDPHKALIEIMTPPGFVRDVLRLLHSLKNENDLHDLRIIDSSDVTVDGQDAEN